MVLFFSSFSQGDCASCMQASPLLFVSVARRLFTLDFLLVLLAAKHHYALILTDVT